MMNLYDGYLETLKIQKFWRMVSYAGFYCFTVLITYTYTNNTTRAGYSRGDQFYASYPAGTELLTDTAKVRQSVMESTILAATVWRHPWDREALVQTRNRTKFNAKLFVGRIKQ